MKYFREMGCIKIHVQPQLCIFNIITSSSILLSGILLSLLLLFSTYILLEELSYAAGRAST